MIHFIISGWHFNNYKNKQGVVCVNNSLIDGLIELKTNNIQDINVFWSCHREPTADNIIKYSNYKIFENVGLEWGAYQQALEYLENIKMLQSEDIIFFMHDDLLIKDWNFINECVYCMVEEGYDIIGNGVNYMDVINPYKIAPCSKYLKNKENYRYIDYVKDENKSLYKNTNINVTSIRGSFICTKKKILDKINGFDYLNIPQNILNYTNKFDVFGNTSLYMNAWKFTYYLGKIKYLSNIYRKSDFIIELAQNIDM